MARLTSFLRGERGSLSPFILIMMISLVIVGGLTYDVGQLFAARREANNVAAASARAGASQVTEVSLYNSNPELDIGLATSRAQTFAISSGMDSATAAVIGGGTAVEVQVETSFETLFLSVIGIDELSIGGEAEARVVHGVDDAVN